MIKAITNVDEINKIIRNEIIAQTDISQENIRNAVSKFGVSLSKELSDDIFKALERNDNFILYELKTPTNSTNVSLRDKNGVITYYTSFNVHIIIYGNNSINYSKLLYAKLLSNDCRVRLQNEGVYLQNITNYETINEFINNVMWIRCDFDLELSCKLDITKTVFDYKMEALNEINVSNMED